jgi:homoserine kinase
VGIKQNRLYMPSPSANLCPGFDVSFIAPDNVSDASSLKDEWEEKNASIKLVQTPLYSVKVLQDRGSLTDAVRASVTHALNGAESDLTGVCARDEC